MSHRIYAADLADIPPGQGIAVSTPGLSIAVFNLSGTLFALDNACARCGSALAPGRVNPPQITCEACGWRYDVTTGVVQGLESIRLDTYRVSVAGSKVYVETPWPT